MNIFSMCFYKHSYGKFGMPFRVYGAHWIQIRMCKVCGVADVKNIGFLNTSEIIVPKD